MIKYSYNSIEVYYTADAISHVIIFNPINSGRLINIEKVYMSAIIREESFIYPSICGVRCIAPSETSLEAKSSYGILNTYAPEPVALIRKNVTGATLQGIIFSMSGFDNIGNTGNTQGGQYDFLSDTSPVILQEGEGLSIYQNAGDTSANLFNVAIFWDEIIGVKRYKEKD